MPCCSGIWSLCTQKLDNIKSQVALPLKGWNSRPVRHHYQTPRGKNTRTWTEKREDTTGQSRYLSCWRVCSRSREISRIICFVNRLLDLIVNVFRMYLHFFTAHTKTEGTCGGVLFIGHGFTGPGHLRSDWAVCGSWTKGSRTPLRIYLDLIYKKARWKMCASLYCQLWT